MRRVAGGLVLVLALLSSCSSGDKPAPSDTSKLIVSPAPDGLQPALGALRGKPVVVNFWATWCEPCKNEMPRIVAAERKYQGRVNFLGVDVEDDLRTASSFIKRYGMRFKSLSDPDGDIRKDEHILGLPVTLFYTSDGDLAFLHNGEIQTDELKKKIEGVLENRAGSSG